MRHRISNSFVISCLSLQIHHGPAQVSSLAHSSLGRRCVLLSPWGKKRGNRLFQQRQYQDGPPKDTTKAATSTTSVAAQAFAILAKQRKTWDRLGHLVELAQDMQAHSPAPQTLHSVVDIGTDHGILPIALAATGQFDCVTGVDVSEQALNDGARTLYQDVQSNLASLSSATNDQHHQEAQVPLPVEFILGNGLMVVDPGAADIVCIAGMGVHTMLDILVTAETERVGCRALLLQPTNSKPKNLMALYDALQQQRGWQLVDERIEKQSSRWYLSAAFVRSSSQEQSDLKTLLPGTFLQSLDEGRDDNGTMKATFDEYVQHHSSWLEADMKIKGGLGKDELLWMEKFHTNQ